MADTDGNEWILLDPNLTTRLDVLPAESSHLYLEVNEPGSGSLKIPLDSTAAALVTVGQFAAAYYRGALRGGFFIDNISKDEANADERGGRWMTINGRGALSLLDNVSVLSNGTTEKTRSFSAMTMADILLTLIAETQAEGGLSNLTDDFSPTNDSAAVAWTDSDDWNFTVGTSLLNVLRYFASSGGVDFDINLSGGNFVLSAYKNEIGTDKSASVFMRTGENCEEVSSETRGDEISNVIRVLYENGTITVQDATSIAAYGRREKFVNADVAPNSTLAAIIGNAELNRYKDPRSSISLKVYDGVGPRIFVDYDLGDYVSLDVLGVKTSYRILGVQLDWVGNQYSSIILEMNTIFYENDIRQQQNIDWLMMQLTKLKDAGAGASIWINKWFGLTQEGDGAGVARVNIIAADPTNQFIFIGGRFTTFGGLDAPYIIRYSLTTRQFSTVGDSVLGNKVDCIAFDAYGNAYFGGDFLNVGGDATADRIIKLNIATNAYTSIAGGFIFGVDRIYIVGDNLFALSVSTIRRYDIGTGLWDATPITNSLHAVYAIWEVTGSGDYLYAGGQSLELTAISGVETMLRYRISTTTWSSISPPALTSLGRTEKILVSGGYLYIAGSYFQYPTNDLILRWNILTTTWENLTVFHDYVAYPNQFAVGLGVDEDGNILLGSYEDTTESNLIVTRLNITSLEWEDLGGDFAGGVGGINAFALDASGNIYAGGGNSGVEGTTPGMFQVYIASLENALEYLQDEIKNSMHPPVTIGSPANGLSITGNQVLSIALAGAATIGAVSASAQTFAGVKTFSSDPLIPDEAYDATTWDGSLEPPTKNAVRDKIETVVAGAIGGTGVVGQVAEFVTNTKTLQAAKIIGPAANILTITNSAASTLALAITSAKTLTLTATDNFNLTIPATGTAALLATQNAFSDLNTFNIAGYGKIMSFGAAVSYEVGYFSYDSGTGQFRLYGSPYGALGLYSQANKDVVLVPGTGQVKAEVTNAAANAQSTVLNAAALLTQTSSGNFNNYGLVADVAFSLNTGVTNTESQIGFIGGINVSAAHLGTQTYIIALQPTNTLLNGAGGVITTAIGNRVRGLTYAGTVTTAVTNVYGEKIETPTFGGGTLANIYGLYLEDQTGASTLNFAIYTNAGQVRIGDDLFFAGAGSGLPYGGCSASDMATPFSQAATQNTWYAITDAEISASPLNLMTHSNGVLTITKAGTYLVIWAVEVDSSIANKHVSVGISIDAAAPAFHQSILVVPTTEEVLLTGTRVLSVTAGQTLGLALRTTDTGTPTLTCAHLSLSVVMVGG